MDDILAGIGQAFTLINIAFLSLGIFVGVIIGAIPGLNAPMAIAIAVPLTYYLPTTAAIGFLLGINKGGTFGGSIAAILLNTPGTPEATVATLDGYPLAKKGKGEKAMKKTTTVPTERWRLLDTPPMSAAENMCLDYVLAELKGEEQSPNTIRFLQFNPPTVLAGHQQEMAFTLRAN